MPIQFTCPAAAFGERKCAVTLPVGIGCVMVLVLNLPSIRQWVRLLTIPRRWLPSGILR